MLDYYRVLVPDHLGFGFSDKPKNYDYLLTSQADIVVKLCQHLGIGEVQLMAHDYGTSVATELIARQNEGALKVKLLSCTLCNGSMLINMAKLRPIQRLLKHKWIGPVVAQLATKGLLPGT